MCLVYIVNTQNFQLALRITFGSRIIFTDASKKARVDMLEQRVEHFPSFRDSDRNRKSKVIIFLCVMMVI